MELLGGLRDGLADGLVLVEHAVVAEPQEAVDRAAETRERHHVGRTLDDALRVGQTHRRRLPRPHDDHGRAPGVLRLVGVGLEAVLLQHSAAQIVEARQRDGRGDGRDVRPQRLRGQRLGVLLGLLDQTTPRRRQRDDCSSDSSDASDLHCDLPCCSYMDPTIIQYMYDMCQ